jgi:hypothetical protein
MARVTYGLLPDHANGHSIAVKLTSIKLRNCAVAVSSMREIVSGPG